FSVSTLKKESEDEMLWDVAKNCISQLNLVDCVIYLIDAKRGVLVQKAAYGPKNPKDYAIYNPIEIPFGKGITGHVAKTGVPEMIGNAAKDPRYIADDVARLSEITIPIVLDHQVLGVIDCEHPRAHFFTKQHLRLLTGIANLCAVSIQNLRNNNRIKEEQKKRFLLQKEFLDLKIKALSNQLNPHFVFNALNAIQHFILKGEKSTALRYLTTFSRLIRFYLNYLEKDTVPLVKELEMLDRYLTLQKLRYDGKFYFKITPTKDLKNTSGNIPPFVLQPLLENMVENTINDGHENIQLDIKVKIKGDMVLVKVVTGSSLKIEDNLRNNPEYRDNMLKWQDYIRLLNRLKGYNIKKKASLHGIQNTILLELPNLTTNIN